MVLLNNTFETFIEFSKIKRVIAYGASTYLKGNISNYPEIDLVNKIEYIVDGDDKKNGTVITLCDRSVSIYSLDKLFSENLDDIMILITSCQYAYDIYTMLEKQEQLKSVPVMVLPYLLTEHIDEEDYSIFDRNKERDKKIPPIIHCFWFSGEKKDYILQKCIESWKEACPNYEIIEWNTTNYDIGINPNMKKAYEMKKWAMITDYARFDVINKMGGFYLDLDVELFSSLDPIRCHDFVIGFGPCRDIEPAAFGAVKESVFLKKMMDDFWSVKYEWKQIEAGNIVTKYNKLMMQREGFLMNGKFQEKNNDALYPRDVFSNRNFLTEEIIRTPITLGVHHCTGGWKSSDYQRQRYETKEQMLRIKEIYKGVK